MSLLLDIFGLGSWLYAGQPTIALSLPLEIWHNIFSRIPLGSRAALRATCRVLKDAYAFPSGYYDLGNRPLPQEIWSRPWVQDVTHLRMGQRVTVYNTHSWLMAPDRPILAADTPRSMSRLVFLDLTLDMTLRSGMNHWNNPDLDQYRWCPELRDSIDLPQLKFLTLDLRNRYKLSFLDLFRSLYWTKAFRMPCLEVLCVTQTSAHSVNVYSDDWVTVFDSLLAFSASLRTVTLPISWTHNYVTPWDATESPFVNIPCFLRSLRMRRDVIPVMLPEGSIARALSVLDIVAATGPFRRGSQHHIPGSFFSRFPPLPGLRVLRVRSCVPMDVIMWMRQYPTVRRLYVDSPAASAPAPADLDCLCHRTLLLLLSVYEEPGRVLGKGGLYRVLIERGASGVFLRRSMTALPAGPYAKALHTATADELFSPS